MDLARLQLRETIAPIVDRLYVYDNSINDQDAQLLFRLGNGVLIKKYCENTPLWAVNFCRGEKLDRVISC